MARPRKELDLKAIQKLAEFQCTDREIAAICDMTQEGFSRRKKADEELSHILEKGREVGKKSLRRWQHELAEKGNATMQIWLGKQYLGQRDKHEQELKGSFSVEIVKPARGGKDESE